VKLHKSNVYAHAFLTPKFKYQLTMEAIASSPAMMDTVMLAVGVSRTCSPLSMSITT